MESNLLKAVKNNNFEKVEDILSQGKVNINAQDENGRTALYTACHKGNSAIAKLVLEKGGNPSITKHDGKSPLYIACFYNNADCVQLLCNDSKADVNVCENNGGSPVYVAAQNDCVAALGLLVSAGADINLPMNDSTTPVFISAQKNNGRCLQLLIEKGADVDLSTNSLFTPAMIASQNNSVECLKMLVEAKANLNLQNVNGMTALCTAARKGNLDCVKLLVEGGAEMNLSDSGGFSPLCYASNYGCEEVAAYLIQAGADTSLTGWNGNSALHLAAWNGQSELFANTVWLNCFCKSASQINRSNSYGFTPLHLAALGKQASTVQILLDHGADVNLQTNLRETPLHCAVLGGNNDCIENIANARKLDGSLKNLYDMTASDLYCQQHPDKSLPSLIREKVNLTDSSQLAMQIPANKFVEVAKVKNPSISLENVKLISKKQFLGAGVIPHYSYCELQGWHITAKQLRRNNRVLFISHRWGSKDKPDPDGAQYSIVVDFLQSSKGQPIEFIWADYSCICQDKESILFKVHLDNIPTSVWTATDLLIIPKVVADTLVTHLKDYLSRGWCVLEAMAGIATGTNCHLSFRAGGYISHEEFGRPEGAASNLGFYQASVNVWHRLNNSEYKAIRGAMKELWGIVEPCAILGLLIKAINSRDSKTQQIIEKALDLSLNLEEIHSAPEEVKKIWDLMGECEVEKDKVPVMNLMLFIGYYSLNMPSSDEMDSDSFGMEETKETKVRQTEQNVLKQEKHNDGMNKDFERLMEEHTRLMEKHESLIEKNESLMEKNESLMEKNETLMEKNETLMEKIESLMGEHKTQRNNSVQMENDPNKLLKKDDKINLAESYVCNVM